MANTVETIWKLILDDKEARDSESMIQRLSRLIKEKLGGDSTAAINKTTEAIKDQTEALKDQETQAKKTGDATSSVGAGDAAGKLGGGLGSIGRLSGVGSLVGAGEGLGMIGDIGDAVEGLGELGGTIAELGPAAAVAGPALLLLGAVIADFAKGAQEQAEQFKEYFDAQREVFDEIASGSTSDDIREQIELLQFRRELEKSTLEEATAAYASYEEQIRSSFGVLGDLILGILRIIDPREEELAKQKEQSEKNIQQSEAKEKAYNKALEDGLTSKADAKQAEEERTKAAEEAAREQEKVQKEQERAREKAAAEAERAAQQAQQKAEQAAQKRLETERKYTDTLVDIARKGQDDAAAALKTLKQTQGDNQADFWQDISDISRDFQESEREEAIKRAEQELQDAQDQTRKLETIRDEALKSEQDFERQRDFLSATKVREQANARIEQENKTFLEAQGDKLRAQRAEDAAQLRELDKSRRDRLQALNQANAQAKQAYQRDLENQRESQKIAQREAAIARQREIRNASETARALLGISTQSQKAQLQLAASTLNQLRGMTTVNNTGNTVNGGLNFSISGGGGGLSASQVQSQILSTLGSVGLA